MISFIKLPRDRESLGFLFGVAYLTKRISERHSLQYISACVLLLLNAFFHYLNNSSISTLLFLLIGLMRTPYDTTLCTRPTGNPFKAALCVLAFLVALGHCPRSKSCPWHEASTLEIPPQSRLSFPFIFQIYFSSTWEGWEDALAERNMW